MPFMARGQQLAQTHLGHRAPKLFNLGQSALQRRLPLTGFGNELGDRAAVAGDDDGFARLDLIEQRQKARFRFGGLNFTHDFDQSV